VLPSLQETAKGVEGGCTAAGDRLFVHDPTDTAPGAAVACRGDHQCQGELL
jgi:hypothetical protein